MNYDCMARPIKVRDNYCCLRSLVWLLWPIKNWVISFRRKSQWPMGTIKFKSDSISNPMYNVLNHHHSASLFHEPPLICHLITGQFIYLLSIVVTNTTSVSSANYDNQQMEYSGPFLLSFSLSLSFLRHAHLHIQIARQLSITIHNHINCCCLPRSEGGITTSRALLLLNPRPSTVCQRERTEATRRHFMSLYL